MLRMSSVEGNLRRREDDRAFWGSLWLRAWFIESCLSPSEIGIEIEGKSRVEIRRRTGGSRQQQRTRERWFWERLTRVCTYMRINTRLFS